MKYSGRAISHQTEVAVSQPHTEASQPLLPIPHTINGRLFFVEADLEQYKEAIVRVGSAKTGCRAAQLQKGVHEAHDGNKPRSIKLIPATEAARQLGVHRRTLSRRIREAILSRSVA